MKTIASLWMLALLALVGISAAPVHSQCSGCGGSASSAGGAASTAGGCPCAGSSAAGGQARRNPTPGGPVVRAEAMPEWRSPGMEVLEAAAAEKRPLVVYFANEADSIVALVGEDMAELSKTSAIFIKVPHSAERTPAPDASASPVPVNRLLSDNPARDFNVPVGKTAVLILDWYGNEHNRVSTSVKVAVLARHVELVSKRVDDLNGKLEKTLEKAKAAHEQADRKEALKQIMRNFKEGFVGMAAQEETIRLYRAIMDEARAEMEKLAERKDADALRSLAKELKRTDLEQDISNTIRDIG